MDFFFAAAKCNTGNTTGLLYGGPLPQTCANSDTVTIVFNTIFIIVGAMALLVMVIGGARYSLSKGEPENIQKAKNELKYSAIGLIIVSLAAALVNLVINRLK